MTVTFLFKLLLILLLSLIWVRRENEFASLILLLTSLSLACHWVWYERMTCPWFTAMSRFLRVREGYFALLIPSKWEFREEYVQTIKCLLHIVILWAPRNWWNWIGLELSTTTFAVLSLVCAGWTDSLLKSLSELFSTLPLWEMLFLFTNCLTSIFDSTFY